MTIVKIRVTKKDIELLLRLGKIVLLYPKAEIQKGSLIIERPSEVRIELMED